MIIITGDSWSCGEWQEMTIVHKGLQQYLIDNKFSTINLGKGGDSNLGSYTRLSSFLQSGILDYTEKITHVLYFQTGWERDYQCNITRDLIFPKKIKSISEINDLITQTICQWQYRLSDLAQKYKFKFGLIGGCNDTIYLDNFSKEYPGLEVLCQSMTNLCVNGQHRIDRPIYSTCPNWIDLIKQELNDMTEINQLLNEMCRIESRYDEWKNNPKYFWPDGGHANRVGHKKLFDFILDSGFLR
jgi:hypothetical protein